MQRLLTFRIDRQLPALVLALTLCGLGSDTSRAAVQEHFSKEQLEFFESKIRPVLVEHCYECHSGAASNAGKLEGGFMLDSREELRKGGESGPVLIPGKASESLLISALQYDALEMPPKGKLPDAIIADFAKWIDAGAPDPRDVQPAGTMRKLDLEKGRQFWAFLPLRMEPRAPFDAEVINPVDYFIGNKQLELGLQMSPVATPRVLIRRAWFDLLGLPPSPDEMKLWSSRLTESATAAEPIDMRAWSELIDDLLSRPEYGERWARHWMDIARFAESFGYEQDYDRPNAYHYRDFLIRAFNSDLPYDKFVQWQIAGDQLEPENPLAWMATGFLGAGAFPTQLTEAEFESTRYDELDDMVSTMGVAFLGLSIGCARCHDHKFDPLASEDYYRLAATFERTIRAEKPFDLDPDGNRERQATFVTKLQSAQDELARYSAEALPREFRAWLAAGDDSLGKAATWQVLAGRLVSSGNTTFQPLPDGSFLAVGSAPDHEVLTFDSLSIRGSVNSLRIEALSDPSLPMQGPGRAPNGNFALGNLQVELVDREGNTEKVSLTSPRATFQQNSDSLSVAASIDSDPISGWAIDGQIGRNQAAVFDLEQPLVLGTDRHLRTVLTFNHPNAKHAIGHIRFSISAKQDAVPEVGSFGPPPDVREALVKLGAASPEESQEAERLSSPDWQLALDWYKSRSPTWLELSSKLAAIEKSGPEIKLTQVMVSSDGLPHLPHHADDRGYPHFYPETYLLRRGDVHQKVSLVTPGYPQVLQRGSSPTETAAQDLSVAGTSSRPRSALANWLTDIRTGPGALLARVIVNRLWQHHFGRGIVATPNDFGEMGDRPTHPELLDWLAQRLLEEGWRLKPMHRVIMTSRTYLQANKDNTEARLQIDPENANLWYRAPRRLEAEAIRDSMLLVSGQLDHAMYGPGSLDLNMKRRSIYFFIKRSQLISSMMLFDWPEHLVSIGQRQATTVAPQALMFMNSEFGRICAEAFAQRVFVDSEKQAVDAAYTLAFGRNPSEKEIQVAQEFLSRARRLREERGESDFQVQALADFCQMLMSTNEFIYVD